CEHQRRNLGTQLLRCAQRRAVDLSLLRSANLDRQLELERRAAACPLQCDSPRAFSESDELRVRARARRKPLRADVQRLEQVRLAGAVLADYEDETGPKVEVEPRVRPDVAQGDRRDDQTA